MVNMMKTPDKREKIIRRIIWAFLLIGINVCVRHSPPSLQLIHLQQCISVAQDESEQQDILVQLENYYLRMAVPDTIKDQVRAEVNRLITGYNPNQFAVDAVEFDTNAYHSAGGIC